MQTKSEMINRIAELAKENAELKAENERLKARKDKYYQQTLDNEIQINELLQTLQEIKAIAEADVHIVGDEKLYYYSIEKILQVITKAEEE